MEFTSYWCLNKRRTQLIPKCWFVYLCQNIVFSDFTTSPRATEDITLSELFSQAVQHST